MFQCRIYPVYQNSGQICVSHPKLYKVQIRMASGSNRSCRTYKHHMLKISCMESASESNAIVVMISAFCQAIYLLYVFLIREQSLWLYTLYCGKFVKVFTFAMYVCSKLQEPRKAGFRRVWSGHSCHVEIIS